MATTLRKAAERQPDITTGVACAGTAIESRTYKARDKAFLFLGARDARLKLTDSVAEASRFPGRVQVGAGGWTKLVFDGDGAAPSAAQLQRWVAESYRAFAAPAKKKKKATASSAK